LYPQLSRMQCACAVLYCYLWPVWFHPNVPHYLTNSIIFGKKLLDTKWVFWFSLQILSETLPILRRIQRQTIHAQTSSCKAPFILVRFSSNLNFLDGVLKNPQISYLMKIRPVGAKLFHADGQTAESRQANRHDKANGHFSQFCERAKTIKINKLFHADTHPCPGWSANPQPHWSSGRTQ
jgi:hypothetical protein